MSETFDDLNSRRRNGVQASELPWKAPGKLSFDLSGLKNFGDNLDSFAEDFKVCPIRCDTPSIWLFLP